MTSVYSLYTQAQWRSRPASLYTPVLQISNHGMAPCPQLAPIMCVPLSGSLVPRGSTSSNKASSCAILRICRFSNDHSFRSPLARLPLLLLLLRHALVLRHRANTGRRKRGLSKTRGMYNAPSLSLSLALSRQERAHRMLGAAIVRATLSPIRSTVKDAPGTAIRRQGRPRDTAVQSFKDHHTQIVATAYVHSLPSHSPRR